MPCSFRRTVASRIASTAPPYSSCARGVSFSTSSSVVAAPFSQIGVEIDPGSMIETGIPHGRSSWRSESVSASIADFDAAYGPTNGGGTRPPIEPMLTIRPPPVRSSGMQAWVTASCPMMLTSNCRRTSSRGRNSSGPPTAIPALFTSPPRPRPSVCSPICATAASIDAPSATSMRTGARRSDASSASRRPSSSLRTPANTRKPRPSSSSAQARPIPVEAPVTSTAPPSLSSAAAIPAADPTRSRRIDSA
ncbi:MAG: hypothetical protein QOK04_494 [Solirubrobacteraceae bacterium]|nr:hypothetical protein [Solirubrobacteraceae bacterium]